MLKFKLVKASTESKKEEEKLELLNNKNDNKKINRSSLMELKL
jgi:hypothetical protein